MAKRGKLQTQAEYLFARSLLALLGALPLSAAMGLGSVIANFASVFARDLKRTGMRNLQIAFPDMTDKQRRRIVGNVFSSLGRQLGVFSHFPRLTPESLRATIEIEGEHYLTDAKAQGRGVILFTGHLGAWELTSFAHSVLETPFNFVVRRVDNPLIERLVEQLRSKYGNRTLDKLTAARTMVKTLRSGDVLGLLIDLNTLHDEAIFVDFFGVPAATNFMIAKLALRTGSPIVPAFAPWDARKKKFLVRVLPPIEVEANCNEDTDVLRLTAAMSRVMEDIIRQYPEQWLWIHKRWKTRRPGEPSLYQ
ncbi:MAG: lysophospholipid acyltransferase family protein [Pyrinomonadaceae bacterium]